MIPQAFDSFAHILVYLSALEFILAQAPRTLQGFLIGLWYAMQSVYLGIAISGYISCAAFCWQYYASKTFLVFISFFPFVVIAHNYRYRQLNEEADINVQQEVENVFERNFDREDAYEQRFQRALEDIDVTESSNSEN